MVDTKRYRADQFMRLSGETYRWNEGNQSWDKVVDAERKIAGSKVSFAELDENNEVIWLTEVDSIRSQDEASGVGYLKSLFGDDTHWVQNSGKRNAAEIGRTFDAEKNLFISPKPFPSWVLKQDDTGNWEPPVPYPVDADDKHYGWDEEKGAWALSGGEDKSEYGWMP